MQTAANISFILTDSSSFKRLADPEAISYGGLYQLLASGLANRASSEQISQILSDKFVAIAEHFYGFRQMDALELISQVLMSSPLLHKYEAVGRYYQALRIQKFGGGDVEQATRLLELVAENAPPRYRARAMQSLGTNSFYKSDYESALSHYREAGRFASSINIYDPYATLGTQKMAAVINGLEGNHRDAVAQLENLFSLAHAMRSLQPHVYYDYMNSLAVELCEVGRLEEAENVSRIVLASPFARAYPEWRETLEEIELKGRRPSRTRVAFSRRSPEAENLVHMPVQERGDSRSVEPTQGTRPASVTSLQEWKTKMPKSNGDPQELTTPGPGTNEERRARLVELEKLTVRQKLLRIMEVLGDEGVTDEQLLKALVILEDVESN